MSGNGLRNARSETNENEFENPVNSIHFPPPRSPLNTIQDPSSQNPREIVEDESDSRIRLAGNQIGRILGKNAEASELVLGISNYWTPKGVRGKSHSEPNSVQSTPAKSSSKVSNYGMSGSYNGNRALQCTGAKGGSFSRAAKGKSDVIFWPSVEVPHFDLIEDPSFWTDHNVQVLIRIRPLSNKERSLQGNGRCLRQESERSLTWLGHPETRFTFDHIVCETITQEMLFKVAGLPMVENCMSGYNSCMFAYGQTGSGKTYTMMGEVFEINNKLSEDCGMTPRIFEYLFTRIKEGEESRRDEKLTYSCKCSFLEIYNEQITDLLEPSSNNLQLREDMKNGVYVENLKEYDVATVEDVVKLLLQGAANRKMAATDMNSESSRSHSVFTCVIESRWEKDSMTHLRFGRLNLVDLAGSERQKSSGAEGERLKEAANINKSLSTLGLVIMTLVDVAHGKHRHVPYRDSRLTFLLQDSLGGNSKTTIIANVTPSICSVTETLSTLKFAQRAKLIQNNAKVNEDASGNVMALQRQIQQLKDQLNFVLNDQNIARPLSFHTQNIEQANFGEFHACNPSLEGNSRYAPTNLSVTNRKMECMEAVLVGALRREKMAETAVRRLEAEIAHMNRLVHQQEEDAQRTKMILRFREEKIRRMELLANGLMSADEYLAEENNVLSEEIQLLQARIDRSPELTRFALENIRLIEQLRMFQDFYEQGERETLLAEVSELRDQLLEVINETYEEAKLPSRIIVQDEVKIDQTVQERAALLKEAGDMEKELEVYKKNLDACLETNATLAREVDNMHCQLKRYLIGSGTVLRTDEDPVSRNSDTTMEIVNHSSVKLTSVRTDSEDEIESHKQVDKSLQIKCDAITLQPIDAQKELVDAKYLIEAMESDQICLIKEIENLKEENNRYLKLLRCNDHNHIRSIIQLKTHSGLSERQETSEKLGHQDWGQVTKGGGISKSALQTKLEKLQRDLDEATILNRRYQDDQASQLSHQHEVERVREQVEVETAKTIIHLQEELSALLQEIDSMKASESLEIRHSVLLKTENQELQERLCLVTQENILLKKAIADRENEMSGLGEEWEKAIFDLTSFLIDGYQSIEDASDQIENIVNSFPPRKSLISEHVEKAVKVFIEKEKLIALLQKKLEDAEKMGFELKVNLSSLKGATLAITEVQQLENNESVKEVIHLKTLLSEKLSVIHDLEKKIKSREGQLIEAEKRADDAFVALERLSEVNAKLSLHTINAQGKDAEQEILELNMNYTIEQDKNRSQDMKAEASARAMEEIGEQVEMAMERVLDSDTAICASYVDTEKYLSSLLSDIIDASPEARQLVQDFINDVCTMKKKFIGLKEQNTKNPCLIVASPSFNARGSGKLRNQYALLLSVRDELAKTNEKLNVLKNGIDTLSSTYGCSVEVGDEAMLGLNILASTTCKSSLCTPKCVLCCNNNVIEEMNKIESEAEEKSDELLSSISHTGFSGETTEEKQDLLPVRDSTFVLSDHGEFQGPGKDLIPNDATIWYLRKEVKSAFSSLMNIHVQLSMLLDDKEVAKHTYGQGRHFYESLAVGIDNPQLNMDCKETSNRLVTLEADQMLQIFEHRVEKAGAGCSKSRQMLSQKLNDARLVAEEKMKAANSLLLKFEEAQETIKEADHLLTALVIENDNAKHKTNRWKQAGEELMTERATLIEEVQQLKASIHLKEEQYEFLHDQINGSSVEIMDSISSLENLFLLMRRTVEEEFKVIYSDIFSFGRELLDYIGTSRSWLEDICSEIMEKGFFLSVLYQCHLGILSENILSLNGGSTFLQYGHGRSNPVPSNMDKIFMDSNREGMEFKVLNDTTEGVGREHSQYGLSGSEGILKDTFRIVQHTVVGSVTDTDFRKCEGPAHSLDLQHYLEKVAKLEEENFGIVHDMQFIKEAITKQLIYLEKFGQELNSLREVSYGVAFPVTHGSPKMGAIAEQLLQAKVSTSSDTSHSSIFYDLGIQSHKIQNHIVSLAQKEGEATKEDVGDVITDGKALYDGIQNLKNQCAQLIALLAEKKDHPKLPLYDKEGMHGNSIEIEKWHLNCLETKTEYGHHSIQALNKLGDKLSYLTGDIYSVMHAETENRLNAPLLETLFQDICSIEEKASIFLVRSSENEVRQTDGISENLSLKRELTRKEDLLKGLLFDFRLLQESTSNAKDLKDETETMMAVLSKLQHELTSKTSLLDDLSVQYIELETQLTDSEAALSSSKSELERAHETLDMLLKENTELRFLLEDLYVKKTDTEEQLEEKKQVVKGLEREILHMTSSVDERILSSIEDIEDELRRVTNERDHLHEEVVSLNDKLEMVNALADENEAIAIEARQVSEASKVVAEQKEEEARILEHSVEELECTINMLEKKVYEMGEEVERHRLMRDNLELELQVLRERMLTVENVTETSNVEERSENQMSRHIDNGILELCEANRRIQVLEKEKANQEEEIKKCREYISELVLHAEAQTSQYQQKYKTLEAMVRDVKMDQSTSTVAASTVNKLEKCSTRTRGSGSPFKCIASLVQQMKLEKDQELSEARLHVEELEAVAASRHKEICMLNARLAAAESMTHDVIRDLLGVKLDMTNYANLIDQQQVQKLVEKAQQLTEEFSAKEQEMLKLKNQIDDFIEERESFIEEIDQRQADALAAQVIIEQLQQRDQLLTAQNEMLKMDKANLKKKISELDEMVKKLCGSQKIQLRIHQPPKIKDNNYSRVGNDEHTERLAQSERLLSRVNSELARYRKSYGKDPYINTGEEQMLRK